MFVAGGIDSHGAGRSVDLVMVASSIGRSFDPIPTNQDLYIADESEGRVLKLSHTLLANYVGDLLITQGGAAGGEAELFIVHWNGSHFVTRGFPCPTTTGPTILV